MQAITEMQGDGSRRNNGNTGNNETPRINAESSRINVEQESSNKKIDERMKMLLREMIANCSTKVPRRDVAGFNGDKTQAEMINANGGNSHTTTFCYTPKSVKIAIPIFDGTNPRLWIKKCGRCFSLCNIQEKQKVEIASRCMIGKANEWMSDYLSSWKYASWTDVILSLLDKFHDKMGPDTEERELKKWADSLQKYISECELDAVKDDIAVVEHVEKYVEDEGVMDKEYVQEDVKCDNLDVYLELEGESSELLPEIPEVQLPIDIFKKGAEPVEKFLGEAEIDKEDVQDDVVIENLDESSVLNGSLLVAFAMDGQVKPLLWKDKNSRGVISEVVTSEGFIRSKNIEKLWSELSNGRELTYKVIQSEDSVDMVVFGGMTIPEASDQFYQVPQFSGLKISEQCGSFDNTFENSWKMRPLPWRDKFVKSCLMNYVSVNWISAWGLGIYGPAWLCGFVGSFGYLSVTKWKGMRMDKSFKAELVTGPRFFSYEGLTAATESRTEFLAEMSIRACLRHKNFVQFQGWNLQGMLALCVTEDADKWLTAAALLRFFQICEAFSTFMTSGSLMRFFQICQAFSTFMTSGRLQRWLQISITSYG